MSKDNQVAETTSVFDIISKVAKDTKTKLDQRKLEGKFLKQYSNKLISFDKDDYFTILRFGNSIDSIELIGDNGSVTKMSNIVFFALNIAYQVVNLFVMTSSKEWLNYSHRISNNGQLKIIGGFGNMIVIGDSTVEVQ